MGIGIMIMVSLVGSVHLPLQPSSVTFSLSWRRCYISSIRQFGFLWDRFERRGMTGEADVDCGCGFEPCGWRWAIRCGDVLLRRLRLWRLYYNCW